MYRNAHAPASPAFAGRGRNWRGVSDLPRQFRPSRSRTLVSPFNYFITPLYQGGSEIITLAKIARPFKWVMRKVLTGVFSDIGQQLARDDDNRPIRVELVRKEGRPNGRGRGKHTPFMDEQVRVFRKYLDSHPACASYSVIDRARACWAENAEAWDRAARERVGYSSYKALARAV